MSERIIVAIEVFLKSIIVAFLFGSGAWASESSSKVEEWERLPDGRVVIEIYGQRLAFPTDEETLDRISFSLDKKAYGEFPSVSPRLREIVAQPETTRRLIAERTRKIIITDFLRLPASGSDNPLLADKRVHVRSYIHIWPSARTDRKPVKDCDPIAVDFPASNGFVITSAGTSSNRETKISRIVYCLPAELRLTNSTTPKYFQYNTVMTGAELSYGVNEFISVGSRFDARNVNEHSKYGVKIEQWPEVDRQLHEYFSIMFIDLPEGALQ